MKLIEDALSKWSVQAGAAFAVFWATLAGVWITLDAEVQNSILADWGLTGMTAGKAVGYVMLAAGAAQGITLALRVLKQKPGESAPEVK